MKHFFYGVLFFLFLFPSLCYATINLSISGLNPKDDYYEVDAVVSGMSSSSATFVQGMFTKEDATKYFGSTFSRKGEWLGYDGSPEKSFVLENFIELTNDSPQKIFIKPNFQDQNYNGSGKYILKLKRYTASGSPSDYSNSLELNLNYITPTETTTPILTQSPTTTIIISTTTLTRSVITPTSTPSKPQTTPTPTATKTPSVTPPKSIIASISSTITPEVLGTDSADLNLSTIPKSEQATPSTPIISDKNLFLIGILIFSVSGTLLYFRLKNL